MAAVPPLGDCCPGRSVGRSVGGGGRGRDELLAHIAVRYCLWRPRGAGGCAFCASERGGLVGLSAMFGRTGDGRPKTAGAVQTQVRWLS